MLSDTVDAVIGVDTHRDTHSASLVNAVGGELVRQRQCVMFEALSLVVASSGSGLVVSSPV